MTTPETIATIRRAYAAFNARDIDGVLATMTPDVDWPNGMDGVRAYWTRQWGMIDPHVEPVSFEEDDGGRVIVSVDQVVKDLSGKVLLDRVVQHVYSLRDGLISEMEIRE